MSIDQNPDFLIKIADTIVFQSIGMHLSDVEIKVLIGSWEKLTYEKIAERFGYSSHYLNKDVGNKLWKKLCKALNEPVSKTNFREPIKRWEEQYQVNQSPSKHLIPANPGVPEKYIERTPVETKCFEAILCPGALVRIKAPQKMGKTWLMNQILGYASEAGYQTVTLDLKLADSAVFKDLETFLKWFCVNTADNLCLDDQLEEYWRSVYGLNVNCTRYFYKYILEKTKNSLVLAFDNFDLLFERVHIFKDFCMLLRSWHEKSKTKDAIGQQWQSLHLMVVNSTQSYPALNTNHSPFNVGVSIELPNFTLLQIEELAKSFQIDRAQLEEKRYAPLLELVGGHPYLIQQALSYLYHYHYKLTEVLQEAATEEGIYRDYLHCLLSSLHENPTLKTAFCQVLDAEMGIQLDATLTFQLHSMGLINLQRDVSVASCQLYRDYFRKNLDC